MSVFETEWETYETPEMGEFGEIGQSEYESGEYEQEQFLGGILGSILGGELESPLQEQQEAELASELLEITSEQELDQFLGNLIKRVGRAAGGFIKSPVGKALGGVLKKVAKTALPVVGGALGSFVAPGAGTAIGSKLGSMAANMFELELEGLNEQEAEFEVARRFVRFASSAAASAARAPQQAPPRAVVQRAVATAARQHAPGLVRPGGATAPSRRPPRGRPSSTTTSTYDVWGSGEPGAADTAGWGATGARAKAGRWMRRGSKIVLFGV